jgi:hypothetical protein
MTGLKYPRGDLEVSVREGIMLAIVATVLLTLTAVIFVLKVHTPEKEIGHRLPTVRDSQQVTQPFGGRYSRSYRPTVYAFQIAR